jgi:hypothetical protein
MASPLQFWVSSKKFINKRKNRHLAIFFAYK